MATVVYTDGAVSKNGSVDAIGGVGVYFGHRDPRNCSEQIQPATNQICELLAIQRAIERAGDVTALDIRSDSKYAIQCLTVWHQNWIINDWMNSQNKPVKNQDIIKDILALIQRSTFPITFKHVRGHMSGDDEDAVGNRAADALAVQAKRVSKSGIMALQALFVRPQQKIWLAVDKHRLPPSTKLQSKTALKITGTDDGRVLLFNDSDDDYIQILSGEVVATEI